MLKRIIRLTGVLVSGAVLSLMLFSDKALAASVSGNDGAGLDYIKGRPLTEAEKLEIQAAVESYAGKGGYLADDYDEDVSAAMPSAYSAEGGGAFSDDGSVLQMTGFAGIRLPVEEQKYGDCWAFAALDLLRYSCAVQDIWVPDLSERHLVYYTYHSTVGTGGQQEGEGTSFFDNGSILNCFRYGGNYKYAVRSLSSYVGAVNEGLAPYEQAQYALADNGQAAYGSAAVRLKNAYVIPAYDQKTVKECILNYGAVGITYFSGLTYYNYDTVAQYCPVDIREDHAVVLVGWDDTFSRYNFLEPPSADGAWLAKNNWGTGFGNGGYFWISYEDASISAQAYVMEAEAAAGEEYIYQCDNTVLDGSLMAESTMTAANCYTISGRAGYSEYVKSVGFAVPVGQMSYELQLLRGDECLLPEAVTGYIPYGGYYTVEIPGELQVSYGDSITVRLTLDGDVVGIYTDDTRIYGRIQCNAVGGTGASLLLQEGEWIDFGAEENRNFRIKLVTERGMPETAPLEAHTEEYLRDVYGQFVSLTESGDRTEEAVNFLYLKLLHREGEERGICDWTERLEGGCRNIELFFGFLYSEEYSGIHEETVPVKEDVLLGCLEWELETSLADIRELYRNLLYRDYDLQGMITWSDAKKNGISLEEIGQGFLLSEEYAQLKKTNEK